MKTSLFTLLTFAFAVSGCTAMPSDTRTTMPLTNATLTSAPPTGQYDAHIVEPGNGALLTVEQLAKTLQNADVVVVGEHHGHHGSHLLQARLQQALFHNNPKQLLAMEQFNLDHQPALDDYLSGQTGEAEMIEDTRAWDNYRASYRPLVEFAKDNQIPVIAANAPANTVRCVGRKGSDYLETLPPSARRQLPESPFLDTPAYKDNFVAAIRGSHGTSDTDDELSDRMLNAYRAQLLRDNTMAHRILQARAEHPGHQLLHVTGTFHSEGRLGMVAALEARAPKLTIAVVSPVIWPGTDAKAPLEGNRDKGDYLYFIQPLPDEFKDTDREREAMQARFSRSPAADCD